MDRDISDSQNMEHYEEAILPLHCILVEEIFSMDQNCTNKNHPQKYANLDHLFTNYPQKINGHTVLKYGASHFPKFKKYMNYNKVNWAQARAEIKTDPRLSVAQLSQNSEVAFKALIDVICKKLEQQINNPNFYKKKSPLLPKMRSKI